MNAKRITKNAIMLAIMCLGSVLSIPFGDNVKVSLQILLVFLIVLLSDSFIDSLIVTSLYLIMGLFMPIYAGFNSGVTPTFGYVISFVIMCVPMRLIYHINKLPELLKIVISCFVGLIIAYVVGTIFMMFYLHLSLKQTLLISVVPYIPFDAAKIALATFVIKLIPTRYKLKMYNEKI